jgi:hypothetical protein
MEAAERRGEDPPAVEQESGAFDDSVLCESAVGLCAARCSAHKGG